MGTLPAVDRRAVLGPCLLPLRAAGWRSWTAAAGTVTGAALVATSGAIHLDLWLGTYRYIPTIGPLFVFQAAAALASSGALLAWRRLATAAVSLVLMAATAGGYLISVNAGLFGFTDTFSAPLGVASLAVEAAAVLVLAGTAVLARPWRPAPRPGREAPTTGGRVP